MTIDIHPTAFVSSLADLEISSKGSKIVIGPVVYIDSFVKFKAAGAWRHSDWCRHADQFWLCFVSWKRNFNWRKYFNCCKLCSRPHEP